MVSRRGNASDCVQWKPNPVACSTVSMVCIFCSLQFPFEAFGNDKMPISSDELTRMAEVYKYDHGCYYSEMARRGLDLRFDLTPLDMLGMLP